MNSFRRNGFKMRDLSSAHSAWKTPPTFRSVPEHLSHTPRERLIRKYVGALGAVLFTLNIFCLPFVIAALTASSFSIASDLPYTGFIIVNLLLHIGAVIEMATDRGGKNWYARGVALTWTSIFGTFIIAGIISLIT